MPSKKTIEDPIKALHAENDRRQKANNALFNPVTGEGSIGERVKVVIKDYPIPTQWLPVEMMDEPFVKRLMEAGSIKKFIKTFMVGTADMYEEAANKVVEMFVRIRIRHDFPFWAATLIYIKPKGGGRDVLFRLNRPQRRLIERFERMRKAGKPIRLIILKARQWGGSTCTQLYMAWLQLVHLQGLNSLIIAHQTAGSDEIRDMFTRMIEKYPVEMLHEIGDAYDLNEQKLVGVGNSGIIHRVPQRNFKIKIGTAIRPKTCLGGDYNLVHLSEVAKWRETEGTKPEEVIDNSCAGILLKAYTMIVLESTADGVDNYFHKEYLSAKDGKSQFDYIFVPWYEIELYELPFESKQQRDEFAATLYNRRHSTTVDSNREEPGTFLWRLWEQGATLEALNWYVQERRKFGSHSQMAYMYPSDDVEAFLFSGRKVFAYEDVMQFKAACRPPRAIGEIYGRADVGEEAVKDLRFRKEEGGRLFMWSDVEKDTPDATVTDRYLVVVDVAKGHTEHADFADILVLDRLPIMDGDPPVVVAEWHGHIEMDRLAWKAAQVAAYYNNALLVIESNTLETNNTKGEAEYILTLVADVYSNLYARKQSAEDIQQKLPKKYGFHTNSLTKKVIIYNLQVALREHLYIEREEECLNEYLTYIETDKGGYEAMEGHHDDRLMTRAIGLHISTKEMDVPRIVDRQADQKANNRFQVVSEASIL